MRVFFELRQDPAGVVVVRIELEGLGVVGGGQLVVAPGQVRFTEAVVAVADVGIDLDVETEDVDRRIDVALA